MSKDKKLSFEILKTFAGQWNVIKILEDSNFVFGTANIRKDKNVLFFSTKISSSINKNPTLFKFKIALENEKLSKISDQHNVLFNTTLDNKVLNGHVEYQEWDRWFETHYRFFLDNPNFFTANKIITCPDGKFHEDAIFTRIKQEGLEIVGDADILEV